jgi:hypothetical protein
MLHYEETQQILTKVVTAWVLATASYARRGKVLDQSFEGAALVVEPSKLWSNWIPSVLQVAWLSEAWWLHQSSRCASPKLVVTQMVVKAAAAAAWLKLSWMMSRGRKLVVVTELRTQHWEPATPQRRRHHSNPVHPLAQEVSYSQVDPAVQAGLVARVAKCPQVHQSLLAH